MQKESLRERAVLFVSQMFGLALEAESSLEAPWHLGARQAALAGLAPSRQRGITHPGWERAVSAGDRMCAGTRAALGVTED